MKTVGRVDLPVTSKQRRESIVTVMILTAIRAVSSGERQTRFQVISTHELRSASFHCKGPQSTHFRFEGLMVSVATPQVCLSSTEAAIDNK